jgi:hypothetical protein
VTRVPSNNEEVLDGVPVLAPAVALARVGGAALAERAPLVPARQAAALAAAGFVAGAAVAVVGRRGPRWTARRRRRPKGLLGEIVSSNSFLVDVHLVRRG